MDNKDSDAKTREVSPGYAAFQIGKALITAEQHGDPATRERAEQRISRWKNVLDGMLSGRIDVGSRSPIKGVPPWATLEVVTGGFATGKLLAGGPLLERERALLTDLPPVTDTGARRVLNGYYLTDEGLTDLQDRLKTGRFDVGIPEEGALLVVAWLVGNGYAEEARNLLEELGPYFQELRFYPNLIEHPRLFGSQVFLRDVGAVIDDLANIGPNLDILAQKEAIEIWAALYDQVVGLFLETVEGEIPTLAQAPDGKRTAIHQRFPVEGGWPCQVYPDGWHLRAKKLLDDYDSKRKEHRLSGKPERAKENFPQLREYLGRCIEDPGSLNGRDVGRIRLILASYVTKRGTPDSSLCLEIREKQAQQSGASTFHEVSRVVMSRLENHPKDGGVDDLPAVTHPITGEEEERWKIEAGTSIPVSLQNKVKRCLNETVEALVESGVVTSGETLARVLPQMTSGIRAAGITDPNLRQLYGAIYRAFRRRRSLLLLNLESQVKIEELPWVSAIDRFRHEDISTRELARQTLEEVTSLTIYSFPHMILPNKLIQELRALGKGAGMDLPLVDEIAADIFMGEFSAQYSRATRKAADLLEGTLYETYYGIEYKTVLENTGPGGPRSWFGRIFLSNNFGKICASRAGVTYRGGNPAINGMIIEQQQILTSQNLAVLFNEFDLAGILGNRLDDLAQRCFTWICRRLQVMNDRRHARLIMLKNTAYAWRQMVFFLALLPEARSRDFLAWAEEHLNGQSVDFQTRFRPALLGLGLALDGHSLDDRSATRQGARRFLGWTNTEHWLLR